MYHKIRITVVSLVIMAVALVSSTGTLSYFTDTDSATNNFVVGNAKTTLAIYNDATGGNEHIFNANDYILVDNMNNIPFYLQATNIGNIPVYQRFRIVIPIALAGEITLALPTMNNGCVVEAATNHTCSNANYTVIYNPSVNVGTTPTYAEYYIVSNSILTVGSKTSTWPTTAIKVGAISSVAGYKSLLTCEESDKSGNNCVLGIGVYSDVVQTAGFTDAVSAFANAGETY